MRSDKNIAYVLLLISPEIPEFTSDFNASIIH